MRKRFRQKSISQYIHRSFRLLAAGVVLLLAIISLFLQFINTVHNTRSKLISTTNIAAERIEWAVKSYQNSIETLGYSPVLAQPDTPIEEKRITLNRHAEQFGFTRCQIIDQFGYSLTDGIYRGNRSYYTAAMGGKVYISDPIVARSDGEVTLVVAAPLWKDGQYDTEPIGAVWGSLSPDVLNSLIASLDVSKHTYAFILGQTGTHVATSDSSRASAGYNTILKSLNNPLLSQTAAIERSMIDGIPGDTMILRKGLQLYCWNPIANTPGWTLVLQTPLSDYLDYFYLLGIIILVVCIITFFCTRAVARWISHKAGEPIHVLAEQLNRASLGDLNFDIEEIGTTEDIRLISEASKNLVLRLNNTITFIENYKNSTNLSDFFDEQSIKQLTSFFEQGIFRGFHLIILDNKGVPLAGRRWISEVDQLLTQTEFAVNESSHPSVTSLIVNGRTFGTVGYYIEKDGPITPERAIEIRDMAAHVLTLVAQSSYDRNIQNITRIKNLQDNIQNLVDMETNTSIYLQQLIYKLRESHHQATLIKRITLFREIEQLADYSLESISRAVDYSALNDLNATVEELPYSPMQLAQHITLVAEESGLTHKAHISVTLAEILPSILYGDITNISRIITRIISDMCVSERNNVVSVHISAQKRSYATDISISVSNPKYMLSSSQLARCNAYLAGDSMALGTQSAMTNASLKFLSIVRIVRLVNGTLTLSASVQQGTTYIFTIPQISLDKEVQK